MNTLTKIMEEKNLEIKRLPEIARAELKPPNTNLFLNQLKQEKVNLICEIKPKSPSLNSTQSMDKISRCLEAYETHASCISVLTDKKFFGGGYELLSRVSNNTRLPVLQKDFIIDKKQIDHGLVNGASAVLLIKKLLGKDSLKKLIKYSNELNLFAVVEVNNVDELNCALDCGAEILLINNRNLDDLKVNLGTTRHLAPLIPSSKTIISASGYKTRDELDHVASLVNGFLIGTTFMTAEDPGQCLNSFLGKKPLLSKAG